MPTDAEKPLNQVQRTVICMKWGTLYDAEYVNVLHNAVRANLSLPFQFICLTDDDRGLDTRIEAFPIPEFGLTPKQWQGGGWPKLSVFLGDLYGLSGRALFIDLDMIIVGDLEPFFTYGSGIVVIDEGEWRQRPPSTMSSIFAFDIGAHEQLVDKMQENPEGMEMQYGYEQNYIHGEAETINYWPQSWLASFKRHLRRPLIIDRILPPKAHSKKVRVVVFHGTPRPRDLVEASRGNRDRFPHYVRAPVPWIADYWHKHRDSASLP